MQINDYLSIPDQEIEISAIRSQGAGGQKVNKTSSAIHLRFSVPDSSLPDAVKQRLMEMKDHHMTRDGVIIIKAQEQRSREMNLESAYSRLRDIIVQALVVRKNRRPTKPGKAAVKRRLEDKAAHSALKAARRERFD